MSTNSCYHSSSEFLQWILTIDGEKVPPPDKNWRDEQGVPFHNWRTGGFDNIRNAWTWAWYVATGERFYGTLEHLDAELEKHKLSVNA